MAIEDIVLEYRSAPTDALFERIAAALNPFLGYMGKHFFASGMEPEDWRQEGLRVLWETAIPQWDPLKGGFLSFAKLAVRRRLIVLLKRETQNNGLVALGHAESLDEPHVDDGSLTHGDSMPDPRAVSPSLHAELRDDADAAWIAFERKGPWTPMERWVWTRWAAGWTQAQLAAKWLKLHPESKNPAKLVDNACYRVVTALGIAGRGKKGKAGKKTSKTIKMGNFPPPLPKPPPEALEIRKKRKHMNEQWESRKAMRLYKREWERQHAEERARERQTPHAKAVKKAWRDANRESQNKKWVIGWHQRKRKKKFALCCRNGLEKWRKAQRLAKGVSSEPGEVDP